MTRSTPDTRDAQDAPFRGPLERRRMARADVCIEGKLLGQGRARFVTVRTVDVSAGGALLEFDAEQSDHPVQVGERVGLGLDTGARSLIPLDRIVSARVVRVTGNQAAVEFDEPQTVTRGPGLPAAA